MTCNDVGSSNPDVAGLGVILSFTIQAGLSFGLSLWSVILQLRKSSGSESPTAVAQPDQPRDLHAVLARARPRHRYVQAVLNCVKLIRDYARDRPFLVFRPFIVLSSGLPRLRQDGIRDAKLKIDLIDGVLKTISDIQTLNGISLLIGALTQRRTLSLYHYHVVFDTVNFTGVSMAAALVIVLRKPNAIAWRVSLIFVFLALYFAFVIIFGLQLQSWDDSIAGHCYNAGRISAADAAHPYVDNIYLAITALYLFASLAASLQVARVGMQKFIRDSRDSLAPGQRSPGWIRGLNALDLWLYFASPAMFSDPDFISQLSEGKLPSQLLHSRPDASSQADDASINILAIGLIQYPVHVYTLFALRNSNESYLSGDSENQWGFGQVVALVLVVSVVLECFRAITHYALLRWKRRHPAASGYKRTVLSLLWTLLLDQEGEQESRRPQRRRSLPANMKYH
ncbi:hypothetical protein F5Y14DRAFT_303873 [Nemania sp. NC0429]|nr:hypothetical protein F5Y14DRAFT_303873 [Nemania sp. NC0429]